MLDYIMIFCVSFFAILGCFLASLLTALFPNMIENTKVRVALVFFVLTSAAVYVLFYTIDYSMMRNFIIG